ncbi:BTB/POZ domain-containing protein At1g04390 [Cucurbita moschata]|uniref:BTB/POZ domain-containing protein At1g04390 n=1 Tax=Cucurbita moschata TaxID=3662 RepID=A0A6J1F7J4_CUCMO|nr:BTB/POZ domain-containing protein At1g04390 [Cucurbita moschata]XP_022936465.1 BTB/POZ domain-containing protein At1g04390 [Cucurbita moschata]XP_022936466.1 BTB/POZ domain-containing protein At1g04390 [Cucurbita moschata]XP_022936467.1 BTB/POZ domain-containing protein At1g04390 [Cucurbita moschata]
MRSSRGGGGRVESTSHIHTLHRRLHDALNLGTRFNEQNKRKWMCSDNEVQRHVVRSIAAFLESVPRELCYHHLVKDSIPDIVYSLVWILEDKNGAASSIAADVAIKLFSAIPNALLKPFILDLSHALSCLLPARQIQTSAACATALNLILSNVPSKSEEALWEILKKTEVVLHLIGTIKDFSGAMNPVECIQPLFSLLSIILSRWPLSRFPVWSDAKLMEALYDMYAKPDFSVRAEVLKLYSAIALCGIGAQKLLERGEAILQEMVECMASSRPHHVRIEAFRLAQCLVINEETGLERMSSFCEPIVSAILSAMTECSLQPATVTNNQIWLLEEASRLALITRWAGQHHNYFWKHGIDRALLHLLLGKCPKQLYECTLSLEDQINIAREGLKSNYFPGMRVYIWEILGSLATNFNEDVYLNKSSNRPLIDMLLSCACLAFAELFMGWRQICQSDVVNASKNESLLRAIMMMIYSPSNYIASTTMSMLTTMLEPSIKSYLKDFRHTLTGISFGTISGMPNILIVVNLLSLVCCVGLPQYTVWDKNAEGMKAIVSFVKWCLSNEVHLDRLSYSPHLLFNFHERACCQGPNKEWEGRDILLLYSLVGLAELILQLLPLTNERGTSSLLVGFAEDELISQLQDICGGSYSPGLKWYAAYVLSLLGLYGFPSKLGNRIGRALDGTDYSDIRFIHTNGKSLNAHGVILAARCASLLPPNWPPVIEKIPNHSSSSDKNSSGKIQKEVCLSSHVHDDAMEKLLEYVYKGHLQTGEELTKKLRSLAKRCRIQTLFHLLCRRRPKWGAPFPHFNLVAALGPAGYPFSDITLEAKATKQTSWKCDVCASSFPHMHVHKVILWLSCDYLRALLQSGMKESHSEIIKVPVSWEAMAKLVEWFYSDKLPDPPCGCLWYNMDDQEKLNELQSYVELCWLAEFWFLEDLQEVCLHVIVVCLDIAHHLWVKVLRMAGDFSLWKLAEIAADYIAPLYSQLRNCGDLETLDERLLSMVRAASVRLSQEGN